LAWKIEFTEEAERDLGDLDRTTQRRILKYVHERLAPHPDPRKLGDTLAGPLAGMIRFRVGDYRLLAKADAGKVTILVVKIGNRREVYR
jgi:mRNA interferase RelE/StbE